MLNFEFLRIALVLKNGTIVVIFIKKFYANLAVLFNSKS